MVKKLKIYSMGYLKDDLLSGLVVFLVAIPLCLGVSLASGAPLFAGVIAGFVGGIVVGLISSSRVSVSGPAAGMVAVVLAAITQLQSFNVFLLALMLAGLLQIIIGSLRAGFIADYIPSNVIQGLLCAIGFLIILKQLPFAFTYTNETESLLNAFKVATETLTLKPIETIGEHLNVGAMLISVISLGLLIFFDTTSSPRLKAIPGSVVVVVLGVILNESFSYFSPTLAQFNRELVNIPISYSLTDFFTQFTHPDWSAWRNPNVYFYAFILATVASLEALLNLEAIEKLDTIRQFVSRNRELVAQGVGNTLAGLIGGIPITSVIVRSSVNIQAGAKSKFSSIFHGILILFVAIFIPHWINLIPLASLASILIFVGYKLTKPATFKMMYHQGWQRFLPFIITFVAIVSLNLLTGVLIGLFFSFFFILRQNSKILLDVVNEKHPLRVVKRIILPQHLSFLSKAPLITELDRIPPETHLILDARHTKYIDFDIREVLDTFINNQAPEKNIALNTLGFKAHYDIHNQSDFINVTTRHTQSALTPHDVIDILKEGNKRFLNDRRIHRSVLDDVKATSATQHPIAIVLSCIDSRVPIESIFDMGVGDIFVVRVAGNIVNSDILASMEFACHVAGAKLILVLGHTYCGAIKAACGHHDTSGHLGSLLTKIQPAVKAETMTVEKRNETNTDFVINVTKINVDQVLKDIYRESTVLNRMLHDQSIGLIGALYDVRTGEVQFQDHLYPQP